MAQDARHFLLTSDYPSPFFAYKLTTQLTVPLGEYFNAAHVYIKHNLPYTPLLVGQWSTNSNFNPAYDISNDMPIWVGSEPELAISIGADSTYVRISASHTRSSAQTFYFRLFAMLPPDYAGDVTTTVSDSTKFYLDSEANYPKILNTGSVTLNYRASANIAHNLGYLPQMRLWKELTASPFDDYQTTYTIVSPWCSQTTEYGLYGASVGTSNITIANNPISLAQSKFYYQIYADEV